MASPETSLLAFFSAIDNEGGVIVKDTPKLDIETYIHNYKGRTRFDRLLLIGRSSVPLCIEALKAAITEAKKGRDVQRYREAWQYLRLAAPNDPDAVFDQQWADQTNQSNKMKTQQLEAQLKGYRNNLVKESIRMGHEDMAKFLEEKGDLDGAIEYFTKMRPDVNTAKQIVELGKHLIQVAMQRREWTMVIANVGKISGLQSPDDEKNIKPYLQIMQGVAMLGQQRYADAAGHFLDAGADTNPGAYQDQVTPNDVAIYGGLLALATIDRELLTTRVLDNPKFRGFLELEPHIRRAVTNFVNGRYSACIAILESFRADYLLDIYLQRHIPTLYSQIRSKCIVQYLIPFSCVTLDSMNEAFAIPGQSLEDELVGMIKAGVLQARIDKIDQVITTTTLNPRIKMQRTALGAAEQYEKDILDRIRRISIAAAELEVKGVRKGGAYELPPMNIYPEQSH